MVLLKVIIYSDKAVLSDKVQRLEAQVRKMVSPIELMFNNLLYTPSWMML